MNRQRLLLCIYLLTAFLTVRAESVTFRKFMAADGLSDNTVLCGLRDSYGFMWLGTNNGLNRFDGINNTVFRNIVDENATYENNIITALFEYEDDIWFGGSFGLYLFHRDTNTSSRFDKRTKYGVNISSTVKKIVRAQNGTIWIITLGQGLFIYDPATDQLMQDSRHGAFYSDIIFDNEDGAFLASLDGSIVVYTQTGQYLSRYTIPDYQNDKNSICLEHNDIELFIGTEQGLYRLKDGQTAIEKMALSLPHGGIRSLCLRSKDYLLLGTEWGIYSLLIDSGTMTRLDDPDDRIGGLSDKVINQMVWDGESTLWVMTDMGGVCFMSLPSNSLNHIMVPAGVSGKKPLVNSFCETPDGTLWVGTTTGLYSYNRTTRQLTLVPIDGANYEIDCVMADDDDLWIGTRHNGIIVMNTTTHALRRYQYSADRPYTVTSNDINCLLKTSQNDIYVGTSWSLCRYDRKTENFMWYAEIGAMTNVTDLAEDSRGCVWATSSNHGVFRQTGPHQGFTNYTYKSNTQGTLGSNYTTSVFCDRQGTVWIATKGDGICYYDTETNGFRSFGFPGSPLQNQQSYFISEDLQHNLWVGTENGMIRIGSERQNTHVEPVLASINMIREQKPYNAVFRSADGQLYVGCYGSFISFNPDHIVPNHHRSVVYIMSLILPQQSGDEQLRRSLDHPFFANGEVELPYEDNSFTIRFASPVFSSDKNVLYEYMLTGIDKNWSRPSANTEASYASLPPGDYEFMVREAGNDDSSTYARLLVTVRPPWYRTTLAYIIYVLLIVATIAYLVYRYTKSLSHRYGRRLKEFKQQQEQENFESKIQFFINLVHEIRTPLSLISLPLEQIEESKLSERNQEHARAIRRNMNYLLGITNQLLDFQKAEKGQIQLSLQRCNVNAMLTDAYHQFEDAIKLQNKQLQLQLPTEDIYTVLDRDKVQKVMMNLLGNAFKYAKSEIILRLEQTGEDKLCISVIDDGPGVPPSERDKIFDAYYQIAGDSTAKNLGTGLGLAYAKMLAQAHQGDLDEQDPPGGGSHFSLILPIRKDEVTEPVKPVEPIEPDDTQDTLPPSKPTHRILLVEDNEELLQMTYDALRRYYHITRARDGMEALDVLKYTDIDVIVSDVMMPRMDGIQLCQRVKNDINYSHIPVVLLTAKTSVEAKLEGMQSGADVYLEKPFSSKQLHLQITSLLRMRQHFHERMQQIEGSMPAAEHADSLGMNQQDLLFMERLRQMTDENLRDEEFSIDQLAEQMNMSRSSFYRKIKALTDMTPVDYMKTRRLEHAALLLRQGGRITEVAEQVGFTSSSYFAKCFKARFGVLPKDYVGKQE